MLELADNIAFTMHGIEQKIEIINPFVADIKLLFPEEYAIAEQSGKLIKGISKK